MYNTRSDKPILTVINLALIQHWAIFKVHLPESQIKPLQVQSILVLLSGSHLGDFWWFLLPIKIDHVYFLASRFLILRQCHESLDIFPKSELPGPPDSAQLVSVSRTSLLPAWLCKSSLMLLGNSLFWGFDFPLPFLTSLEQFQTTNPWRPELFWGTAHL